VISPLRMAPPSSKSLGKRKVMEVLMPPPSRIASSSSAPETSEAPPPSPILSFTNVQRAPSEQVNPDPIATSFENDRLRRQLAAAQQDLEQERLRHLQDFEQERLRHSQDIASYESELA